MNNINIHYKKLSKVIQPQIEASGGLCSDWIEEGQTAMVYDLVIV